MTILLQNKCTRSFIKSRGGAWTTDQGRACEFANGLEAVMFCINGHLSDMQILAAFSNPRLNFTVPVANARAT